MKGCEAGPPHRGAVPPRVGVGHQIHFGQGVPVMLARARNPPSKGKMLQQCVC